MNKPLEDKGNSGYNPVTYENIFISFARIKNEEISL